MSHAEPMQTFLKVYGCEVRPWGCVPLGPTPGSGCLDGQIQPRLQPQAGLVASGCKSARAISGPSYVQPKLTYPVRWVHLE